MKKTASHLIIIAGLLIAGIMVTSHAAAQESQISFPVAELGNCGSKEECRTYCDKAENMPSCISFAKKNKLMSEHESAMAETIIKNGGPGNCKSREECEAFCNNIDNIDQCISFAEKNGLMHGEELNEAKKIQAALKRGVKMPPCKNKKDCESYCSNPDNMEMCMNFALEAGLIPQVEAEEMEKLRQAMKKGVKPPPCRGKKECEEFCTRDENLTQCINFAEAAGFMTPEQAERTRKTGGKGPGGCRGAECETFCNNPDNREICFKYSEENGLLPKGERDKMKERPHNMNEMFNQAPPEVTECVKSKLGADKFERMKAGENVYSQGNEFRDCFDGHMRQRGEERGRPDESKFRKPGEHHEKPPQRMEGQPPPESFRQSPHQNFERPPHGEFRDQEGHMRPHDGSTSPQGSFDRPMEGQEGTIRPAGEAQTAPPQETTAPQARLNEYLTATIFNADSKFIKSLSR